MKPLTYNSFMNVLYFSQLYYQGMAEHQNALYQLPGMTDAIVAKSAKKIKGGAQFWEILKTPDMLDKVLGCYDDAQDKERARHYASLLPQIEFTIDVYVDEEGTRADKIYLDDLVTIEFKITDHSIKEGDDAHYMQSQTFPYLKYINWHIFMLGKNPKGLTAIADVRIVV